MANNGGKATKGGAAAPGVNVNGCQCQSVKFLMASDIGRRAKVPHLLASQLMFVLCLSDKHRQTHNTSFSLTHVSYQHLDPSSFSQDFRAMDAQQDHPRIPDLKFRVLIIGRANAGKTSILQKVCDTTEKPEIFGLDSSRTRDQDHRVRSR